MTGGQRKNVVALAAFGMIIVATPTPAQAYIDPASGSMILQLVMGGGASLWLLVKRFFSRKSK